LEVIGQWCEIRTSSKLYERLNAVPISVPLGEKKWHQWKEKVATQTDLGKVLEHLIRLRRTGNENQS
jgi:hypothetical protein